MNEWLQDLLLNSILTRVVGGIPLPKPYFSKHPLSYPDITFHVAGLRDQQQHPRDVQLRHTTGWAMRTNVRHF